MHHKLTRKVAGIITLLIVISITAVSASQAFESRGGETITIEEGTIISDDLYVSANTMTMNGVIQGDLITAGGRLEINGTVEGDLIAAGREIIVNGQVKDDARLAGLALTLDDEAVIGDDVVAAGYSLETEDDSVVNGELLFGGNQALLAGTVIESVQAGVTGLELRGVVEGDLVAGVSDQQDTQLFNPFAFMPDAPALPTVPGGLTFGDQATVGGNLDYTSPDQTNVPSDVVTGQVIYSEVTEEAAEPATPEPAFGTLGWMFEQVRSLAALLLVGLLLVWIAPGPARRATNKLRTRPLASLGLGLVAIIAILFAFAVILVAMVLLALFFGLLTLDNLIGMTVLLGLLALFGLGVLFAFTVAYLAEIVVGYLGGRLILSRINPKWADSRVGALLVGLTLLVILTAIPFVGGFIAFLFVLLGLGALWLLGQEQIRSQVTT